MIERAREPDADTPVPNAVRSAFPDRLLVPRWENIRGGVTFEASSDGAHARSFVKWAPAGSGLDLEAERLRLDWARRHVAVPEVLSHGSDVSGDWLETRAIDGTSAVSPEWLVRPEIAVRELGRGLRSLHDGLPAADCPFDWTPLARMDAAGLTGSLRDDLVRAAPPVDRFVVCHGDACAPNTLLTEPGRVVGHVDLGALGRGDRWADLAPALWSLEWNFGAGWDDLFLRSYGVDPDPVRLGYYRRLWDAT